MKIKCYIYPRCTIYVKKTLFPKFWFTGTTFYFDEKHKLYFKGYLIHREDGPAIEYINGHKEWFLNGKRHCEYGPARIWSDFSKSYYLNNRTYSEEEYWKIIKTNIIKKQEILKSIL